MKYLQYILFLFYAMDYGLAHLDEAWASDLPNVQFWVFDFSTFMRVGLLVLQVFILLIMCKCRSEKIKLNWFTIFAFITYWAYALYEYKQWLDFQREL